MAFHLCRVTAVLSNYCHIHQNKLKMMSICRLTYLLGPSMLLNPPDRQSSRSAFPCPRYSTSSSLNDAIQPYRPQLGSTQSFESHPILIDPRHATQGSLIFYLTRVYVIVADQWRQPHSSSTSIDPYYFWFSLGNIIKLIPM